VRSSEHATANFTSACALDHAVGCENLLRTQQATPPRQVPPTLKDYPIVLQTGKGPLPDQTPTGLLTRACDREWMNGCEQLGLLHLEGNGIPRDPVEATKWLERACNGGVGTACSNLGLVYYTGDGVAKDRDKGLALLKRACDVGFANACRWLQDAQTAEATK
jgi:TPR repeat protein